MSLRRFHRRPHRSPLAVALTALCCFCLLHLVPPSVSAKNLGFVTGPQGTGLRNAPVKSSVLSSISDSRGATEELTLNEDAGSVAVAQTTFNLVKTIVGSGCLALPAGVSKLAEGGAPMDQVALVTLGLLLLFGLLNAWGFYLVGEVCAKTGASSYGSAWQRTVGHGTAWLPAAASLLMCFTGCVASVTVIGDTFTDLLACVLNVPYGILPHDAIVLCFAAFVLYPLCSLPSLAPLSAASLVGIIGISITAAAMCARLSDASYAELGTFHDSVKWAPTFAPLAENWLPRAGSIAFFCSLLSNAYLAHYNAPAFYRTLSADPNADQSAGLRSLVQLCFVGFVASGLIFLVVALVGYATFGSASQPMILNNYASSDPLAALARIGVGLCVLFEFPLLERPFRESTAEILGMQSIGRAPWATALSVATIVGVSLTGVSLDTVCSLAGGTGGAFLIYVAPALMVLQLRAQTEEQYRASSATVGRSALWMLASFGVALGALGTYEASVSS